MLIDAFMPEGITQIAVDSIFMMPQLGVLANIDSKVLKDAASQAALEVAKFENSAILMEDDHEQVYEEFNPNDPDAYIALSMRQNAFLDQSLILAHSFQKGWRNP